MDIVHLGCGVCGLVCAEQLARHPKVKRLILADKKTEAAESLASRLPGDKAALRRVDGTDPDTLKSLLKEGDVVVAAMPWRLNRIVLETAAQVGMDYVDFGMPFDGTGPEFNRASELCRDAGISALVGMGMEPGMSDVFAMHAAAMLDRTDEVHVFDGDTASVEGLPFFSPWSPVDLLDEMSVPAAVLRDGRIEFLSPMSASRTYEFPDPVGPLTVYKTNHDETYFLPMGIPTLRSASFNIHIDEGLVHATAILRELGLLRLDPVDVGGVWVRPVDVIATTMPSPVRLADRIRGHTCFVVEVTGEKDSRGMKVKLWSGASYEETYRRHRTNATAYLVGTGGAIATEMLLEGKVRRKGLVIPEQLPKEDYLRRLGPKGVDVHEEIRAL